MTGYFSRARLLLPACLAVLLLGCLATAAKWMAYVAVDPDNLNQVLLNADGNVVHVSEQSDGLHIATYDAAGLIVQETTHPIMLTGLERALDLPGGQLLLVGDTLAGAVIVDANLHLISSIESSMLPLDAATRPLTDVVPVLDQKLAAFGSFNDQGWLLVMDFVTGSSELLEMASVTAVSGAYGFELLMLAVESAAGREVVAFDAALNEASRFALPNSEDLIGVSLNRPALFDRNNHNVRVTDLAGNTQWEFDNAEYEFIDGQSVGPDGSILLWGDNASLNLLGVNFDSAHFLMISAEGLLQYHHLGGKDMVNIRYSNIRQFNNGMMQVSYQGMTGQVSGLVIGSSSLGAPFTVTRQVFHDFVTPKGTKTRFMKEPRRVETYTQQCDFLCLPILVSQDEGHCDSLDVFNVNTDSLISVSQVCGATSEEGAFLPDMVSVSLY